MHLVLCPGGLPPLPLDLGPAGGVGVLLDYRLLRVSALSLRWLLRELAKGELLCRCGLPLPAPLLGCLSPFLAVRSHSRGDRSRSSDRYCSRRDRSRFFDRYRSRRQRTRSPARREIGVTARGHTLSRVALDNLPLLPARGQARRDGWPDEICRRVLRRLSLSLLLFLKCRLQLLLRQEELLYRHFRLLCRILPGSF